MEELRLDEDEEGEVEVEEEEEGEDVVEEEVTCEVMDDKLELDETLLMRPVKRPRMGSAQRLLLQEVAGSSVKRPVYEIGGSLWEYACSVAGLSQLKGRSDNVSVGSKEKQETFIKRFITKRSLQQYFHKNFVHKVENCVQAKPFPYL